MSRHSVRLLASGSRESPGPPTQPGVNSAFLGEETLSKDLLIPQALIKEKADKDRSRKTALESASDSRGEKDTRDKSGTQNPVASRHTHANYLSHPAPCLGPRMRLGAWMSSLRQCWAASGSLAAAHLHADHVPAGDTGCLYQPAPQSTHRLVSKVSVSSIEGLIANVSLS